MRNILLTDIEEYSESNNIDTELKKIIEILSSAINDWPEPIESLQDYEIVVSKFLQAEVSRRNINHTLKSIDYNKNSWEAESLNQLLDIYEYYPEEASLKGVIDDLVKKIFFDK